MPKSRPDGSNHSSSVWTFPETPPPPNAIAGIPIDIGMLASVDPTSNRGSTSNLRVVSTAACKSPEVESACRLPSCVHPEVCPNLKTDHAPLISLYRKARALPGIKKILVASGHLAESWTRTSKPTGPPLPVISSSSGARYAFTLPRMTRPPGPDG